MTTSKQRQRPHFDPIPQIKASGETADDRQDWPPNGQDPITFTIKCLMDSAMDANPEIVNDMEARRSFEKTVAQVIETIATSADPRAYAKAALESVWCQRSIELLSPAAEQRLKLEKEENNDARTVMDTALKSTGFLAYTIHTYKVDHEILADGLREIGEHGSVLAKKVRAKGPSPNLTKPWKKTEVLLWTVMLVEALWADKVRPQLELERARQSEPARYPTELARTQLQHGRVTGGVVVENELRIEPPTGWALTLPFDQTLVTRKQGTEDTVSLRQVLQDSSLRTYLATLILYQDAGRRPDGSFEFEEPNTILDLIGATKTKRGYYHSKSRKGVVQDLRLFREIRVRSVGDLEHLGGDVLLSKVRERSTGKTVSFAHARLVAASLREDYMQIPREVCRLEPRDVAIALGIARVIREQAFAHVTKGKTIEAPITVWLDACGIDWRPRVANEGMKYLDGQYDVLSRVADLGTLGKLVIDGHGRDAVVSVAALDDRLLHAYEELKRSKTKHARARREALTRSKRPKR